MFEIKLDGDLTLWTSAENELKIVSPTLNLEVNKIGSLSFRITPDHRYYDRLTKMKSVVSVHQGARTLFKGRVFSDYTDFYKVKKVEVEGLLGYLNDSVVRPYDFSGSVEEYFSMLIEQHNSQVEDFQRFKVGNITATALDANDYIVRASSEALKTWDEINEKLIKLLGGYIVARYEADGIYVDYLADYTDTSTQPIAFSVNLLDLNLENKADTLSTCVIPYGAKNDDTGKRLDITSVNGGVDYIYDEEAVEKYGRIFEVATWDDVTLPDNLLKKAQYYLADKIKLLSKLTVTAVDLHLADETIEAFKLGDYVQIFSEPHGIDERVLLTAYSMDLTNPAGCTITLGLEKSSFLGSQMDANKEAVNRIDIIRKDIGAMVTQELNGIKLGTRNYLRKTDADKYLEEWLPWGSTLALTDDGFIQATPTEGSGVVGAYPPLLTTLKAGETYTLSFEAYADAALTMSYFYIVAAEGNNLLNGSVDITTEPERYSFTFTPAADYENCSILLGYDMTTAGAQVLYLRNPKLEIGNVATDWTPAPEDVTEELSLVTQETYTYVNESIESSEETTRTMLQSYAKTSEVEAVREEVSTSLTQTAEDFTFRFDSLDERLTEENGEIVRILNETASYIRFEDGNIILGKVDNAVTLTIENDLIVFKKNGVRFGWWDGVDFHTGNIVVEVNERAQFGNFAAIPRSNGSLSWLKVK